MWGDADHIKKLKQGEPPPSPTDFPDPKKAKQQQPADRAAQKAAEADARKLAKWSQLRPSPAKPAKQPPATTRPTPTDIANLKAEAWEAKQQQKAMKDAWRAQKELLKAEKAAAKMAQWQAAEDLRLQRETAALGKAAKQRDLARPTSEASYYPYAPPSTGGCATTTYLLLLLAVLIAVLLLCVCGCLA